MVTRFGNCCHPVAEGDRRAGRVATSAVGNGDEVARNWRSNRLPIEATAKVFRRCDNHEPHSKQAI